MWFSTLITVKGIIVLRGVLLNHKTKDSGGILRNIAAKKCKFFYRRRLKPLHLVDRAGICGGEISNNFFALTRDSMALEE